ncbi:MAG: hypothetical protein RL013_855, partial [Bacteroidota bacterium]
MKKRSENSPSRATRNKYMRSKMYPISTPSHHQSGRSFSQLSPAERSPNVVQQSGYFRRTLLSILFSATVSAVLAWNNLPENRPVEVGPFLFMENRGQVRDQFGNRRSDVLYTLKAQGVTVAVTRHGLSYQFSHNPACGAAIPELSGTENGSDIRTDYYRMDVLLAGASENARVVPDRVSGYVENYFNIPDSPEGIIGVRGYERVTLKDVWPGIDWVVYTEKEHVKYDFIVHAGADPSRIKMHYKGALALSLQTDGTLLAVTPMGEIREAAPVCFSGDEEVETRFVLEGEQLSFQVGEYDKT